MHSWKLSNNISNSKIAVLTQATLKAFHLRRLIPSVGEAEIHVVLWKTPQIKLPYSGQLQFKSQSLF